MRMDLTRPKGLPTRVRSHLELSRMTMRVVDRPHLSLTRMSSSAPQGCSLRWYAHPDKPGQGFWQAKIPQGSEPFEGRRSKQLKFKLDDPVESARAQETVLAWLKGWTARASASGSDGGASASGAGA